ncbi:MAG: hypothetical protein KDA16_05815 [Phycisphaerales bacterium]|nr:hypothetical protein [Phycisphaerales bacterium]
MGITLDVPSQWKQTAESTLLGFSGMYQQYQDWVLAQFNEPLRDSGDRYSEALLVGMVIGSIPNRSAALEEITEAYRLGARATADMLDGEVEMSRPESVQLNGRVFTVLEYQITFEPGPYVCRNYFTECSRGVVSFVIQAHPDDLDRFKAICEPIIAQAQIN